MEQRDTRDGWETALGIGDKAGAGQDDGGHGGGLGAEDVFAEGHGLVPGHIEQGEFGGVPVTLGTDGDPCAPDAPGGGGGMEDGASFAIQRGKQAELVGRKGAKP